MKTILYFLALMLISTASFSQYYSTGQEPSSLEWKQINTHDFRIVFPVQYESKARYLATLFQDLKAKAGKDLKHTPKKFSIVLHTQSATSNGMVVWAPKRMELYATAPQDGDNQDWLNHLATHEYRHIIQMDILERGFTRILNTLFGQQATALVVGLYLPAWFMEGDAVCVETALSESGRGRQPEFEQELKAQLLEKGTYSYDKAVLGSYKDFIPNRYTLGYYLVGKSRQHYGDEFWRNTLRKVGAESMKVNCFSTGLKLGMMHKRNQVFAELKERQAIHANTEFDVENIDWDQVQELNTHKDGKLTLYADVMSELKWEWQVQDKKRIAAPSKWITKPKAIYTHYRFPHLSDEGDLLLSKSGLADAQSFVSIDAQGTEKTVFIPGFDYRTGYDYKNGKLLWSEYKADLRWQHADKALIVSYDTKTGKRKTYKQKQNCYAPVFSGDGKRILAVEMHPDGTCALVIIDENTNEMIQRIKANGNAFFMTPQWAKNDKSIIVMIQSNDEKCLVDIDLKSEKRRVLYRAGKTNISQPLVSDRYVFFTSSHTGTDNIFAYEWESGQVSQLTSSRFGARDPYFDADHNTLYYSDYSADGYEPHAVDIDHCLWKKQEGEAYTFPLAGQLSDQLGEKLQADTLNLAQWQVKPYNRLTHTFNFHSWAPVFISPDEENMDIGISASSQNLLNTLFTTVGYRKQEGYDKGQFYLNLSYQRFFPIFNSKLEYGKPSLAYFGQRKNLSTGEDESLPLDTEWKQVEWENSVTLPFNLSSGRHSVFLRPKFSYNIYQFRDYQTQILSSEFNPQFYNLNIANRTLTELEYQLYFSHSVKASKRDLQSPWAQYLQFAYRNSPSKESNAGELWSALGQFNFPGFAKHHGISLYAGYQNRSELNTIFGNSIKSPRGVSDLFGFDCAIVSADYRMPIAYPDWSMGGLAYFKRIKMGAFIDYGIEKGHFIHNESLINFDNRITSAGLEFTADMHVLRLPIPLNLGFRLGYENETNAVFGNLLLSYSFDL
ncbi:hypothetical protein EO244_06875 [Ancylomarina salipaludis]|uniref:Bacterial surface antigen (D15) domain-containing protein n=1 Tax=Ancylomarina salipaludis TaxID=2501299 RepID=A0A4Q1JM60_9BACT|nr:hypothetical protein [Ancylomarina salipaludis]RXQ95581.1 hypothetical protein EO244_06875 [Ancylomarina salipaludis]